jgi:hypothetical protein
MSALSFLTSHGVSGLRMRSLDALLPSRGKREIQDAASKSAGIPHVTSHAMRNAFRSWLDLPGIRSNPIQLNLG